MRDTPAIETSLSRFTRALVSVIAPVDAARRELLQRAGLPPGCALGPFGDEAAQKIWQVAESVSGDAELGLHMAAAATMEDVGVLSYLARASATFGEACVRAVQFERLLKNGSQVCIVTEAAGARLLDTPLPGRAPWPRHLAEAIMALWWIWPQRFAGVACRPTVVRFQHGRPASTAEHERIFGCAVEFGRPHNEIVIAEAVWSLPLPSADPLLRRYLEPVAEAELQRLSAEDPLLQRIQSRILEVMPSGVVDANRLARMVGLSRRTLHRRLSERGLTFQGLVDDLRRQTAMPLLKGRAHTFMEVAFLVGFADASSLRRACRRWEGSGPGAREG